MKWHLMCCWITAVLMLLLGTGGLVGAASAVFDLHATAPRLSRGESLRMLMPHLLLFPSLIAGLSLFRKCHRVLRGGPTV